MPPSMLRLEWDPNKKPLFYGLISGVLWGFLTAASATPPEWLVYDRAKGVVYKFLDYEIQTAMVGADNFFTQFNLTLIQITLTYLMLVAPAGWATWQLRRIRPRSVEQPSLWRGLDWYLIGLAAGGLILVALFRQLGWAMWFKGAVFTPARVVSIALEILLPLYMGISLFLVWFFRLKSVRAPNWETAYPKPVRKPGGIFGFKGSWLKKGGDSKNS